MITIQQLKLPIHHTGKDLENKIKKELGLKKEETLTYTIRKKSLDARKKPELFYVYTVELTLPKEDKLLARAKSKNISKSKPESYQLPKPTNLDNSRPVVVGAGPAGLFCAYILCLAKRPPLVLERGKKVADRQADVARFWETGLLDPASNVQFGEGGAGTFSDGKLNTGVKDPMGRNHFVLETFVKYGADPSILYEQKPHIGTDVLSKVIQAMREDMIALGAEFRFSSQFIDFDQEDGRLLSLKVKNLTDQTIDTLACSQLVLATGHSARDTFAQLYERKLTMEQKNFAVGFRLEHPQSMMNLSLYGPQTLALPAAPYKVTSNFPGGRGVYSFCMCPGGYVVNSSSEEGRLCVNGMSYSGRKGSNANSAIIITVGRQEFASDHPLAGIAYQRQLEEKAFALGKGKIPQQLFGDFKQGCQTSAYGDFASSAKGATAFCNLRGLFSPEMEESFLLGMEEFGKKIKGFDRKDAILSGVEARTSSPLRILRDENLESNIKGIYPCGEGAGYAGGITSAAMDGMKVAEALLKAKS